MNSRSAVVMVNFCLLVSALPMPAAFAAASPLKTVEAKDCSVPAIQEAVASVSADGGVVRIPAGEAEAVGTISVPGGVYLVGAGADKTKLFRGAASDMNKDGDSVILANGANQRPVRIEGINVVGFLDSNSSGADGGIAVVKSTDFRVHSCRVQRFGSAGITVRGACAGVVDHCLLVDNFKKPINNLGYGVAVYGTGEWIKDLAPGTAASVFIEDCEFVGQRHAVASNTGARYVFRHNWIHGNDVSHGVDAHGPGFGSEHGTQWVEVYQNVIEKPAGGFVAMQFRGGGGVVFDNKINGYRAGIELTLDFDTSKDWTVPYPIPEQISNFWVWRNKLNSRQTEPFIGGRSVNHIKERRDYFTKPLPGYQPYRYPHPLATQGQAKR